MKKVLSLVLVLTLVLGSFSFAFANPANDVVGTEYEEAVGRLIQLGVLTGYPDGSFKPANTITRAEFAAAVVRAKGLDAAAQASVGATSFTDVPAGHWAAGYINIASKMGFIKGMGDGTYAPAAPITYEQAITLVTRALGYEPAAEARGGYPYGYLIVASENGLLDAVKGTQGLPAPRGLVAQLLDNALEIPLMVQVSYGDRVEHIVSGSRDGVAEKTLLSDLNFTKVVGRVTEINTDKNLIRVGDKSLKVDAGFDFQEAYGLKIRAWYNDADKVVLYTKLDTPIFDAVEYDDQDLYLVGEDKNYDLATDKDGKVIATLLLDGKTVKATDLKDFNADYAKVVLDSYGDIVWAQGFTIEGNIVVEKVDGNVVESYGYEELSLKGYTLVKDGKALTVKDLEENDVVFYNSKVKFAVVANITEEGKIEKVYTDRFVVAGETYRIAGKYLDADNMNDLSSDVLDSMRKEEKEATVFFDFNGDVVLVMGTRAASTTASNYFLLAAPSKSWTDARNGVAYYTLDVLNAEGKIVKYDVKQSEVNAATGTKVKFTATGTWNNVLGQANSVDLILKLTLNTSDKVTDVEVLEHHAIGATALKVTAGYVDGYKLQDSTVIFRADGEDVEDYAITTWAKADEDFTKVEKGVYYVGSNGRVVAMFAEETDAQADNTVYFGRIKDVKTLRNDLKEVTILSEGSEHTFVTETKSITGIEKLEKYAMVKITVVDKTEEIKSVATLTAENAQITGLKPGSKVIETAGKTYELVEKAVIYNDGANTTLRFADLKVGDYLDFYVKEGSSRFTIYAVKVEGPKGPVGTEGVVTYINSDGTGFEVDDVTTYTITEATVIKYNGKTIAVGLTEAVGIIQLGDKVDVKGNVITITESTTLAAAALADAKIAAGTAQSAYTTAGGLATDAVYVAVDTAVTSNVTANIVAKTKALEAATKVLADAATLVTGATSKVVALEAAVTAFDTTEAKLLVAKAAVKPAEDAVALLPAGATKTGLEGRIAAEKVKITAEETAVALANEAAAVILVNAATDKYVMRSVVNNNLGALGINSAITLEAADYLFTVGGSYADAAAIQAALAAYAAL